MRLIRSFKQQLLTYRQHITQLDSRLLAQHPKKQLQISEQQIIILQQQLKRLIQDKLKQVQLQLASQVQALQIVSPLATLERGYSIVMTKQGKIVQNTDDVTIGQQLQVRLNKGQLSVQVVDDNKLVDTLPLFED